MSEMPGLPSGPKIDLSAVQSWRRTALLVLGLVILTFAAFTASSMPFDVESRMHEAVEIVGQVLLLVAIAGRTWCTLYIGGRKKAEIVDAGPYSVCRNPLYCFSILGAVGVGAQFGSISVALAIGLVTVCVFLMVVRKEEQFLGEKFGAPYHAYTQRVPRFIPDIRQWRNVTTMEISPALVTRTFLEASLLLAAIPLCEGIEMLQSSNVLPVLWIAP